MLYIKFHENRTINRKLKNRGCSCGAKSIYFPGTTANLNVYWTFLITWQIHWYAFHFSTTYSLGGVNAQKKRYTHTNLLTYLQRLVKYIIKNWSVKRELWILAWLIILEDLELEEIYFFKTFFFMLSRLFDP